jgi:PAS domain S-box-containing protein
MKDEEKSKNQVIDEIERYKKLYSELEENMADFDLIRPENTAFQEALNFISPLVLELLSLPTVPAIYDFVLDKLQEVIKDSYIIISTFDKDSNSFKVHNIVGITPKMIELAEKLTGIQVYNFYFPTDALDEKTKIFLSSGKLRRVKEGLYYITAGKIPHKTCKMLEKAFGIGEVYVMGFSLEGEMFASINIIMKKESLPINTTTVETILNMASVVLQRKYAEKELKKREHLLSLVTDNMLNVVAHINNEGIFEYISPSVKSVLGYEPYNILNKSVFEFIELTHPDDLEKVTSTFIKANFSYLPGGVQHRFKRADGNYIWIDSLGNPLFDENKKYQGVVFSMTDIDSLKNAEENFRTSLEAKELLLRELHHRVKNNMQIISSLLSLQSQHIKDKRDLKIFESSQTRVKTMAIIYEELYSTQDFTHINLAEYIQNLTKELLTTYITNPRRIKLTVDVKEFKMELETAIPLGLLINEIVSNSLSYAFPDDRNGEIIVKLQKTDDKFVLNVRDNGVGIQEDIDFKKADTLGFQLINNLVNQLDGEIKLNTSKGTAFTVKFSELKYKKRF